ncbi:APC membrane recruitment protein 3 [Ambystoma mexicanum]|uniref:APC membrane recruitment protein 3 n=1 Tax=Ambystoma mexicanum TaxID=8296 RepID=UPI0037E91A90
MELIRGKTFIKSSATPNPDKKAVPDIDVGKNEDARKISSAPVVVEQAQVEAKPSTLAAHTNNKCPIRPARVGQRERIPSIGTSGKLDSKSKTHTGALEKERNEHSAKKDSSRDENSAVPGKIKGRLVGSASFSGFGSPLNANGKRDPAVSPCQSTCSQKMIDYRNFTPQVPFVPAVAKTIPRKRISLKRSKKGLRDIFNIKKNKQESLALSLNKDKMLSPDMPGWIGTAQLPKSGEAFAGDCLAPEVSDGELHYDPTYDYCNVFCEDVASLKSFDSLTGCGEIFADESSAHLEFLNGKENQKTKSICKRNSAGESFQGGMEQLASPAQSETIDFAKFWGRVNQSVRLHQSTLFDRRQLKTSTPEELKTENTSAPQKDPPLLEDKELESPKDSSPDTETPKSDIQESTSTSDEGYYDSFSPGPDEEKKEIRTPGTFPRDSYSGDALYELFYDSSEPLISPILDDELSTSGQTNDLPLSICSFHLEENMASRPSIDMVNQGFLQSSWKGKECLLKLCDTELSLTMGIINWLRNNPGMVSPIDSSISPRSELREISTPPVLPNSPPCHQTTSEKQELLKTPCDAECNPCLASPKDNVNDLAKGNSEGTTKTVRTEVPVQVSPETSSTEQEICTENQSPGSGFQAPSTLSLSPAGMDPTPMFHGHKLRVCPPAMVKELTSDVCGTPKTQVMVAIGKESLCPACRHFLEHGQSELELCSVCMAKLQCTNGIQIPRESPNQVIKNDKPPCLSPRRHSRDFISPVNGGRGQTIVQILEQCVAQVASLQITYKSEQKNVENKYIGNEMKNMLCKMSQYRNNILCSPLSHSNHDTEDKQLPTPLTHGRGLSPAEVQTCSVSSGELGQEAMGELSLGQTQKKDLFLSSRAGTPNLDHSGMIAPSVASTRPNFLPLFGAFPFNGPSAIFPAFCQMTNSQDVFECNQPKLSWELTCSQTVLTQAESPLPQADAALCEAPRSRTSSVTR